MTFPYKLMIASLLPVLFTEGCSSPAGQQDREQLELAQFYFGQSQFEKAAPLYQAALNELSDEPPKDEVLYRLAVCLQGLGRWQEADRYLSRCFNNFTDSKWAPPARRRFGARTWRLQWGVFDNLETARQKILQLAQSGQPADWSPQRINGNLLYAVVSGRYDTYAQAQAVAEKLRRTQQQVAVVPAVPIRLMDRQD